jgi:hypothetical protein
VERSYNTSGKHGETAVGGCSLLEVYTKVLQRVEIPSDAKQKKLAPYQELVKMYKPNT